MNEPSTGRMPLRRGEWMKVENGVVQISRGDGDREMVDGEDIRKVKLQMAEWSLAVISLATVVFGAYFAATQHVLGGLGFALVGLWSLYRTYRERYTLVIWIDNESRPVTVYPENPEECHAAVAKLVRPDETPVTEKEG